jgi:phi13 family phage major tail protein
LPIVGVEKLYVAAVTNDDSSSLTFGTPSYYAGIQEINIKPKINVAKQYAENRLWDKVSMFESADVEVKRADLTSAERAALLGQTLAADGGVYAKDTDEPPYVALLYKAPIRGGHRYGVFYKGAFSLPEDSLKGQEGKIEFQVPTLKAEFQATIYNGMWEYHVDTTDDNCPVDIDDTWFDAVVIPVAATGDTTPPTVSVVPANGASGVAVDANIVWTFSEAINPGCMTSDNFYLIKASDGSLVAGALSIGTNDTVVTFNPTSNLTAEADYTSVCGTGVTDVAGNKLAAPKVAGFTITA